MRRGDRAELPRSARGRRRGVPKASRVAAAFSVQVRGRWRRSGREGGDCGRRQRSDQRLRCLLQLGTKAQRRTLPARVGGPHGHVAERGARDEPLSTGSAAPQPASDGGLRGAGWASAAIRTLGKPTSPRRLPRPKCGQGVSCRVCLSCDSCLLESRSPPRDASAGRSWRWPGCCPRRRSRPNPGRRDSSR